MTLWLLDTDTASLLLQRHPVVSQYIVVNGVDVAISIVTVQELFNGWVVRINSAKSTEELVKLYEKFYKTILLCKKVPILGFEVTASEQLAKLLQEKPSLSKQKLQRDMRIAAIALSQNATLVTRNYRDFSQVPNLLIEDWTV
ncbi:type II toxin-antitoxin system VapC family toxin [Phormidesmis sp. 146-12]